MSIDKRTGDFAHMSQRAMIRHQARIISWLVNRYSPADGVAKIPVAELDAQEGGVELHLVDDHLTVTVGEEGR